MPGYEEIKDAIYGYLEDKLMGEGARTWQEYVTKVGAHIGPYDKEIWDLSVKLDPE